MLQAAIIAEKQGPVQLCTRTGASDIRKDGQCKLECSALND